MSPTQQLSLAWQSLIATLRSLATPALWIPWLLLGAVQVALAIAISAMPPVMALRSPTRAATADADRASASSATLSGSREAPASNAVRPSPSLLCPSLLCA